MKRDILAIGLHIIIALIISCSWYIRGSIIGGGEEGLAFLNPTRTYNLHEYVWGEIQTGQSLAIEQARAPTYHFLSSLYKIGFAPEILQYLTFLLLLILEATSMYFLLKEFGVQSFGGRFFVSFIYAYNPFTYTAVWQRFLLPTIFFVPLLPLSVMFLSKFLTSFKIKYLVIFNICSLFLSFAFSSPANGLTLWIVLGAFFLTQVTGNINRNLKLGFGFLITTATWALTNLWWIVPILLRAEGDYLSAFSTDYNISVLRSLTAQFPLPSNLILAYKNHLVGLDKIAGVVFFTVSLVGLFQRSKQQKFFVTLFLTSAFFLNGSGLLTGRIFEALYANFSPIQLYRNVYEKFGIVLVFVYCLSFYYGIEIIKNKSGKWRVGILLLTLLVSTGTLWTKSLYNRAQISVPHDYREINDLINQDTQDLRILHLSLNPGDGVLYKWSVNYGGVDPSRHLFDKPSMANIVRRSGVDDMWKYVRRSFYSGDFEDFIKYLNIGYIVVHKDLDEKTIGAYPRYVDESYLTTAFDTGGKKSDVCNGKIDLEFVATGDYFYGLCSFAEKASLENSYYLEFEINASVSGSFKLDIQSEGAGHLNFNGQIEKDYSIALGDVNQNKKYVLQLRVPTERYSNFNFDKVENVSIYFYPENKPVDGSAKINLTELKSDSGRHRTVSYSDFEYETNNLRIFRVKEEYFLPRIYVAKDVSLIAGWADLQNQTNLPQAFIFESDLPEKLSEVTLKKLQPSEIKVKKKSTVEYAISVKEATYPFLLIFSESFDTNWKLVAGSKVIDPIKVNGFANGYLIYDAGETQFLLKYILQDKIDFAKRISEVVFSILFIGSLVSLLRQTYEKKS